MSDMHVPEKIINAHKKLSESIRKVGKTYFVWDSNVFQSVVKEIKYFAGLNLISTSDVMYLKNELQQLLTDLEHLSIKGEFNEGHELYIYLSNIDFEATYSYVSRKDYQISLFRVYSINSMDSQSPQICQIQKNWIQSLKRHSTLISGSGEAQRIAFIEKQRTIICIFYVERDSPCCHREALSDVDGIFIEFLRALTGKCGYEAQKTEYYQYFFHDTILFF